MEVVMKRTLLVVGVLFLGACFRHVTSKLAADCAASGADIVCTEQGAVRGVVEGEMLAFKGIPYARPPVGALRWQPTEGAEPWQGVRDGSRYGSMCPQIIGKEVKGEEDCLFINVWRPREMPTQPLPVMVWLTGGAIIVCQGRERPVSAESAIMVKSLFLKVLCL